MSEFFERPPADHTLIGRMIRAARLEPNLYAEVEADKKATGQAATIVFLAAFAEGVCRLRAPAEILLGASLALVAWYVSTCMIFVIGTRLLPERDTRSDFGALLRALGFAYAPGVVRLAGIIEELRFLALFVATVWMLVAMVVAVRHALSYKSQWRAISVCMILLLAQVPIVAMLLLADADRPETLQGMDEPPVVLP